MGVIDIEAILLVALVALLYSTVGHAGASGYLAVFTLLGWAAPDVRPLALVLNVAVSIVATIKFYRAGYFRPKLFVPLALFSVPASVFGGYVSLPAVLVSRVMGIALCASAIWLLIGKREPDSPKAPDLSKAILTGGLIGFLAGLSGTGGGIFLSPLMLYLRWAKLREISAVAAPFILVNSIGGLIGLNLSGSSLPSGWFWCVVAAVAGGGLGSCIGTSHLPTRAIQTLLATVLSIAGMKLLLIAG